MHRIQLIQTGGMQGTHYVLEVVLPEAGDATATVIAEQSWPARPTRRLTVPVGRARFEAAWSQLQTLGALSMPEYEGYPATDLLQGRIELKWPGGSHAFGGYGLGFDGPTAEVIACIEALVGQDRIGVLLSEDGPPDP